MKINLLVTGGAYDSTAGVSALQFCKAALDAGHQIEQVFFYQAGVSHGSSLNTLISDEFDASDAWAVMAQAHQIPLAVCVSASERRGVLSAVQMRESGKPSHNLRSEFSVEGLGSFHAACLASDRTVTFK